MLIAESCEHSSSMYRLQLPAVPHNLSLVLSLLRDLLLKTPQTVTYFVTVDHVLPFEYVKKLVEKLERSKGRVHLVQGVTKSIFSQDFGKSMIVDGEEIKILTPFGSGMNKIAKSGKGRIFYNKLITVESQLYWEGGNILCDGTNCLVGAKTVAMNMHRKKMSKTQVLDILESEFGHPIIILGDVSKAHANPFDHYSGQADFHIDLDVTLIGRTNTDSRPVAIIANSTYDSSLYNRIIEETNLLEGHFLSKPHLLDVFNRSLQESFEERQPMIDSYKSALEGAGYKCVEMIDMRLSQKVNFLGKKNFSFNYINGLPLSIENCKPFFYFFEYGIEFLDSAAKLVYESLGIEPIVINEHQSTSASDFLFLRGGLHCVASKVC